MAKDQEKESLKNRAKLKAKLKITEISKGLLIILIAITAGFFGGWYGGQSNTNNKTVAPVTRQIIESEGNLINTIAGDVSPSVVSVNVTSTSVAQDFFGFGRSVESQSAGTGVILSKDGYIITNRHVVPKGTTSVTVALSDGTELDAEVVGRTNDSDTLDIAFLKIKDIGSNKIVPVKIGDSSKVEVGDKVVAIGNALGRFQNTVTSGIISGFGRNIQAYGAGSVESLQNLFQTDAAINSGNSGGPLVNTASEVIGINVATASAQNISFAIPINDVKSLIDGVLKNGKLERPYLGVRFVTLSKAIAGRFKLPVTQGAYIPKGTINRPSVLAGSSAKKAGIQAEDVITEIDSTKLDDKNTLVSVLSKKHVGDSIEIKILRGDKKITLTAVLDAVPDQ